MFSGGSSSGSSGPLSITDRVGSSSVTSVWEAAGHCSDSLCPSVGVCFSGRCPLEAEVRLQWREREKLDRCQLLIVSTDGQYSQYEVLDSDR